MAPPRPSPDYNPGVKLKCCGATSQPSPRELPSAALTDLPTPIGKSTIPSSHLGTDDDTASYASHDMSAPSLLD